MVVRIGMHVVVIVIPVAYRLMKCTDPDGQVIDPDPKQNQCIKYDDQIYYLQGAGVDNHCLNGNCYKVSKHTREVCMSNKPSEGKWYLRSSNTITPTPDLSNPNTLDPRHGECIRSRDHIYFQYSSTRYMVGGRNTGNFDVYIRWKTRAPWAFEIQSDYDIEGKTTTEPARPLTLS